MAGMCCSLNVDQFVSEFLALSFSFLLFSTDLFELVVCDSFLFPLPFVVSILERVD